MIPDFNRDDAMLYIYKLRQDLHAAQELIKALEAGMVELRKQLNKETTGERGTTTETKRFDRPN